MGAQLAGLLRATSAVVGAAGALRGLQHYAALPANAEVPLRFGIFDEVSWSVASKHSFLLYPATCVAVGLGPLLSRSGPSSLTPPAWVRDRATFDLIAGVARDATQLLTSALLLAITEQAPAIAAKRQNSLQPAGLTLGFLAVLGSLWGGSVAAAWKWAS
eukprot:CAMPEP_0170238004 /NCGR_PEP_ID=MMETSP0116_2-20130129/18756_1 /TAXON_ID=400756 /ORGANISM="Durinskia baltica, Strain CSIRO CS-38" /LENGTH=159 /DNA_ID=CAMNT_0010488815 /DNA_START=137 /DNA_END=616 /DNA_ORIENTATION=-